MCKINIGENDMRKRNFFEAYLDDFHKVMVYMHLTYYEGKSSAFYLEDENHQQLPLTIVEDIIVGDYHQYECKLEGDIVFGNEYQLFCEHARSIPLQFAYIVKQDRFDEMFYVDDVDLGVTYCVDQSIFRLWAPTAYRVYLSLKHRGKTDMIEMQRKDRGVYEVCVREDLYHAEYEYYVEVNGMVNRCIDPYGKASTPNSKKSVVVDVSNIHVKEYDLPEMKSNCDAVIYEVSVRDYTKQGTLLEFVSEEKGSALSYIKDLGVTHIQFLPLLDFKSVDDLDRKHYYNWGYDAYEWMAFENSYSSNVHNASTILEDVAYMVEMCHKNGLRVNLDVVFNHLYDKERSALECSVPHYYFQYNEAGTYSNATMCGNDIDSTRKMCRKLIVDSCAYLAQTFKIDGFRFDLMGILDIETMNEVVAVCKKINPDFMVYGEGWDMPSYLPQAQRASMYNNSAMPEIAHFSDRFRDVVKGSTDHHSIGNLGYLLSDVHKIYQCMNVLGASTQEIGDNRLFMNASQCINYVECHDNMTSWDKIDAAIQRGERVKKLHHRLLIASVLLAQGIPFLHGGQEFARTKHGAHNTYNAPDEVNRINWALMEQNADIVQYVKELIQIRKQYSCLRQYKAESIHRNVSYQIYGNGVLQYHVKDENEDLLIFFNPTYTTYGYEVDPSYEMIFYNNLLKDAEHPLHIDIHGVTLVIFRKIKRNVEK